MQRLLTLALEINDGHVEVLVHLKNSIESILLAAKRKALVGQHLIESKELVIHGEWMSWLERYCPAVGLRVAQKYMAFARVWPELGPRLEAAANANERSHLERLQLVRGLLLAAAGDEPGDDVQPVVPDQVIKASAVQRWADGLAVRCERFRVSDAGVEEKRALRTSLEPAVRLYEALGII